VDARDTADADRAVDAAEALSRDGARETESRDAELRL
jgi:hypothetical protein